MRVANIHYFQILGTKIIFQEALYFWRKKAAGYAFEQEQCTGLASASTCTEPKLRSKPMAAKSSIVMSDVENVNLDLIKIWLNTLSKES